MKVGILTFSRALNFGAALQAFALQKSVEQYGVDTELIDYHNPQIDGMHKIRPVMKGKRKWKVRLHNLLYNIVFFPRRIKYFLFFLREKRSKEYYPSTISELNGRYDIIISGSDQVFNKRLTGNDRNFYLRFLQRGLKVSYAASMGAFDKDKKEEYYQDLSSFHHLSVREETTANALLSEINIHAKVVPDPVFLLNSVEWKRQLHIRSNTYGKYILVYALFEDVKLYDLASKISSMCNEKILSITKELRPLGKADHYIRNAGPEDFLSLIANADYIVTNSFHGTAFSVIFNKQFITMLPPNAPERIADLLRELGLEERAVNSVEEMPGSSIDYSTVNPVLDSMTKAGKEFLKCIIEE